MSHPRMSHPHAGTKKNGKDVGDWYSSGDDKKATSSTPLSDPLLSPNTSLTALSSRASIAPTRTNAL